MLSALFILTNNDQYKEQMLKDCKVVNNEYKQQKATKAQSENWVDYKDVVAKGEEMLREIMPMLNHKAPIND